MTRQVGACVRLWHAHFRHQNIDLVCQLEKREMVTGLTLNSPDFDHVCKPCVLGKKHRHPFPKRSKKSYWKSKLVVTDLTGPMLVETWSGSSYGLVVKEMSCRFGIGRLLKPKDKVTSTVIKILTLLKCWGGEKVLSLRTDNGTEFVNNTMEAHCKEHGIRQETTVPYSLEQNAVAERAISIYFYMVRCMLLASNLPLQYWGEAFMYAVHLRNISPTVALDKVPHPLGHGGSPMSCTSRCSAVRRTRTSQRRFEAASSS